MKYRIWEHFSPEARRAAATAEYDRGVTPDGCCPLGVALIVDKVPYPGLNGSTWSAPAAELVAEGLVDLHFDDDWADREALICTEAEVFISDWDGGEVEPGWQAALLAVDAAPGPADGGAG